jgi:NAD(P)-dependent dehydrogenase (short-subunit alcohol dehydrogenase family)
MSLKSLGIKLRLREKIVVVTGATGLLGREHVLAILNEGGRVVILDINKEALADFDQELNPKHKGNFLSLYCDITDEHNLMEVLQKTIQVFGIPTGLVNNAAINPSVEKNSHRFNRIEDITQNVWDSEFKVGLWGAFLCSRIFGQAMVDSNTSGSIVNISSDHGLIAPNQNLYRIDGYSENRQPVKPVTYSVIKHALIGLTKYMATYWAKETVRVNTLCPGGVLNGQDEIFLTRFNALVPMGRPAQSHEYRGALVFMLSDESTYMTGATIVVDGGRSVW